MAIMQTTTRLQLALRDRLRAYLAQRDPLALLALLLIVPILGLASGSALYRSISTPTPAEQPTQRPIIIIATAQSEARPTPALPTDESKAAPIGHVLARAVVAYDAPAGKVIGAIDRGHAYQVVARYGTDWLQADVAGSGVVWLATADLFDLPGGLSDLAPTPLPEIVTIPGAPQTVYVSAPAQPAEPSYHTDAQPAAPDVLGPPPTPWSSAESQAAYRQQIGLSDAEVDQALAEHQAQQAASCDAGRIADGAYCDAVRQWLEAQR